MSDDVSMETETAVRIMFLFPDWCNITSLRLCIGLSLGHSLDFSISAVMLVVVFAICWAPFHIDRVMWSYIEDWREEQHRAFEYVHLLSGVFFYLSSAVNPILYSLMSTRFRELFREVTCWKAEQKFNITQITFRTTV